MFKGKSQRTWHLVSTCGKEVDGDREPSVWLELDLEKDVFRALPWHPTLDLFTFDHLVDTKKSKCGPG